MFQVKVGRNREQTVERKNSFLYQILKIQHFGLKK